MTISIAESLSNLSYSELETKGVAFFLEKKYDKANLFFNEMLKRQNLKENPSPGELGMVYYCLGKVSQGKNELNKAILFFEKAIVFYKKQTVHDKIEVSLYFSIAIVYYQNKEKERALKYSKTAITLAMTAYGSNATFTASCMVSHAIILYNMKHKKKAVEFLKRAHKILISSQKEEKAAKRIAKLLKKWTSQ